MATLKETRKRILSAKTVHKITKAMKLISASKSRTTQLANATSRPYSEAAFSFVQNLWSITNYKLHPLLKNNVSANHCSVIIATDRGLCGGLLDRLENFLEKEGVLNRPQDTFILIGKKGVDLLVKRNFAVEALFELGFKKPTFDFVNPIVSLIKTGYLAEKYSEVNVYYTGFVNALRQEPGRRQILPAMKLLEKAARNDIAIYEPDADKVLDSLLPRYLEIQLYQLILESVASEHAARMLAMDKATTNAEEIIDGLTLVYNKERQENITKELLEITTTISAL